LSAGLSRVSMRRQYSASVLQSHVTPKCAKVRRGGGHHPVVEGADRGALAGDLRRDALHDLAGGAPSTRRLNSDWPIMSMKPGATTSPVHRCGCVPRGLQLTDRGNPVA